MVYLKLARVCVCALLCEMALELFTVGICELYSYTVFPSCKYWLGPKWTGERLEKTNMILGDTLFIW